MCQKIHREKYPLVKSNRMAFQFSCWTAAQPRYLWIGSCCFLSCSPLGEGRWASPLGKYFIGLGLRWKSHRRIAMLTASSPQQEQFQFGWGFRKPRWANESFTHLDLSWLSPSWPWEYFVLNTIPAPAATGLAWLQRSFSTHCCTGNDFSEKQMYD